jgi:thiol-disulfide isomerase/thioredoxin
VKYFIVIFLLFNCSAIYCQSVHVIRFNDLVELLNRKDDTTVVLNFWATWCRPCIKELPSFDSLYLSQQGKKVRIVLVSVDDVQQLERKVIPFVRERKVRPQVVLLDETDYNLWIERVDPTWGGAIPATLIFNTASRYRRFIEGSVNHQLLVKYVNASFRTMTRSK